MRKYLYMILAAVILLEVITIIIFRETLAGYVKNTISAVAEYMIAIVICIGIVIWLINRMR